MSELDAQQVKEEILEWFNKEAELSQSSSYPTKPENEYNGRVWDFFYDALDSYSKESVSLASGEAVLVDDVGGGEGDGEERYIVFTIGGQFFKVSGYYASWDGTTWDDIDPFKVTPHEETVIRYY